VEDAMSDRVLYTDKYGNKILLIKNTGGDPGYDLLTNGRVFLNASLAKKLAAKLLDFVAKEERGM
jgi:hypothetical protein